MKLGFIIINLSSKFFDDMIHYISMRDILNWGNSVSPIQ